METLGDRFTDYNKRPTLVGMMVGRCVGRRGARNLGNPLYFLLFAMSLELIANFFFLMKEG